MIKSMTGFGRGDCLLDGNNFTVELKTVNHRYCDVFIKIPKQMTFLEDKVRDFITGSISRGKIDVYISYENSSEDSREVVFDETLVNAYKEALITLRDEYSLKDDITVSLLSGFPNVLKIQKADQDEDELWKVLKKALDNAMTTLVAMRENEGKKLKENIIEKIDTIENTLSNVKTHSPEVVKDYKQKLTTRITEILDQRVPDETRLAMEVAIFADRCSVDEEIVRLSSHINQVRQTLNLVEPVGRKLDFLIQEMNREVNTIGSKANNLTITKDVVDIKCELEKVREQIQNIE
ncbi:MAG: YicC/YloC family endoribonuclease [Clostridia bacterium]